MVVGSFSLKYSTLNVQLSTFKEVMVVEKLK